MQALIAVDATSGLVDLSTDSRPYRRNKAPFPNSSGVLQTQSAVNGRKVVCKRATKTFSRAFYCLLVYLASSLTLIG